jgi:hypothetical protein
MINNKKNFEWGISFSRIHNTLHTHFFLDQ